MKWFPSSLRARTLLLMITSIIACQAITLAVLGAYRHTFLVAKGRENMASHMLLVREAIANGSVEEVASHLEHSIGGRRMRLIPSIPGNATTALPALATYPQAVVDGLREDYGADAVRFTSSPEPALYVRISPQGWWLMMPFSRFEAPIPWPTLVATLLAVGLMAVFVAFYVMHLSRPLRTLAEAARQFEVGKRPQLVLSGPDEVRAVTAQFNAMAERLGQNDAERRVMLAGLPHDLRAPLSRAKLRLALMEGVEERTGLERDLGEIERIADQFVAYLRGLDHDTTRFTDVEVGALLVDRARTWQDAGQDLAAEQVDNMVLRGDSMALQRAVDNLISNAFAHGAAPVRVRGIAGENSYHIEVEDHGPGIPESLRAAAIEPFVRLDSARGNTGATPQNAGNSRSIATEGGHCGLGLAVVNAVSRLHGGRVALRNAPNGGLIAAIVLPCGRQSLAVAA